jgi:hypothetical protein
MSREKITLWADNSPPPRHTIMSGRYLNCGVISMYSNVKFICVQLNRGRKSAV